MAVRPIDSEKYMELLKEQYLHNQSMGNSQAARAWQGAIQLLYDMPTLTPPNEWVSVEELREMEGQWIVIKAFDSEISGIMPAFIKDQFATTLCELGSKAIVPDLCEVHFSFKEYGKTWIAYRRPPEGEV